MSDRHLVYPRWVWAGLVLALIGAAVLGLGVSLTSLWISILGAIALLTGALAAVRGGVLFNAHRAQTLAEELSDVRDGRVHEGIVPGQQAVGGEAVRRETRAATATAPAATAGTRHAPRPTLAPVGGAMLLVAATFILAAQGSLFPHTPTAQDNAARDLGLAVLAGLVGLRVLTSPRAHPIAAGIAVVAGIGLLLLAFLSDHDATTVAVAEAICGTWIVLAGLLCAGRPPPPGG